VVPVAFLGTRLPGAEKSQIPPRGTRIAVGYGTPVHFSAIPWPRRKQTVAEATSRVQEALVETVDFTKSQSGLDLPGPLGGEQDD
jgi:1-acyl-sn-glycerol-3-phosphate acyltransferase